jgi:hypothetical protein
MQVVLLLILHPLHRHKVASVATCWDFIGEQPDSVQTLDMGGVHMHLEELPLRHATSDMEAVL